jgi:hypothetical protein
MMRAIAGIGALLVGMLVGLFVYRSYLTLPVATDPTMPSQAKGAAPPTPAQTVNIFGIKTDLLSIAEAERVHQAAHSSVASLDELIAGGDINMKSAGREGYKYEIEPADEGENFRVIARCTPAFAGCTNYVIDQNMDITTTTEP